FDVGGNFCDFCGHNFDKISRAEIVQDVKRPIVSINISKTQTLVFYNEFLIYKGIRIKYKDIDGFSYSLTTTKHSINFIPTHTSSSFKIKLEAENNNYEINSSATSFMLFETNTQKEKKEIFGKIVYVIDNLIKPFALMNLLIKYAREKELKIGIYLTINSKGFYKKRFWRSPDFLSWDQYYNSVLDKGNFYILMKDDTKKYKQFFSCPISVMNAPVLPEFLNFLFQSNGLLNQDIIVDLEKRRTELISLEVQGKNENSEIGNFCWSCSAPNEIGQKFCTHCGSKLL
ncbi:MAG: zinc ribbon domain-containing protein, partial [bacterium]|nr:zinc ribbon domain-containing protein [bacterium]